MARKVTVERLMKEYLSEFASQQFNNAGSTWKQQQMTFYFPGNEDTTDICAIRVLRATLAHDGTAVTDSVETGVRRLVNTDTTADASIETIWLASFVPVSIP